MRKLVTIRQVIDIQPIDGANFIEVITVDGWKLVSKKGEFKVNDYCMYFEIDSLLPLSDERFSFLSSRSIKNVDGIDYHRLKSMKLKGQISQGLALPISSFTNLVGYTVVPTSEYLEFDYSESLGGY